MFEVKDSGKREEFPTGSVRDTREGKGRFDLISPIALRRLAEHYERGARKYGERNWEKGQPLDRYIDSALRHINAFQVGDRAEDHLIAAAWNLFAHVHTEEMIATRCCAPGCAKQRSGLWMYCSRECYIRSEGACSPGS
jgi:hypothetical protein